MDNLQLAKAMVPLVVSLPVTVTGLPVAHPRVKATETPTNIPADHPVIILTLPPRADHRVTNLMHLRLADRHHKAGLLNPPEALSDHARQPSGSILSSGNGSRRLTETIVVISPRLNYSRLWSTVIGLLST